MSNVQQDRVLDLHIGDVCIPNISPRARRRRLMGGVISLVITLALLAVLIAIGANHWWRLALFLFFSSASTSFFQWRDKT